MSHTYEFNVSMSCGGCSGAVDRAIKKLDGVDSHEVSLDTQTAKVVSSSLEFQTVYEKIAKTGKTVNSAKVDGNPVDLPVLAA
jgi:copper chaperone